jgi:predicted enzyme related to lactoylglutathione lyase
MSSGPTNEVSVFRDRSVSYLELPAIDVARSRQFYSRVLGWRVHDDAFTDGSGHVIGHWRTDLQAAGDRGIRPYIYATGIDAVLAAVEVEGGEVVTPRYLEGDLWVARFRDPAGNIVGLWERQK